MKFAEGDRVIVNGNCGAYCMTRGRVVGTYGPGNIRVETDIVRDDGSQVCVIFKDNALDHDVHLHPPRDPTTGLPAGRVEDGEFQS